MFQKDCFLSSPLSTTDSLSIFLAIKDSCQYYESVTKSCQIYGSCQCAICPNYIERELLELKEL